MSMKSKVQNLDAIVTHLVHFRFGTVLEVREVTVSLFPHLGHTCTHLQTLPHLRRDSTPARSCRCGTSQTLRPGWTCEEFFIRDKVEQRCSQDAGARRQRLWRVVRGGEERRGGVSGSFETNTSYNQTSVRLLDYCSVKM